jgi:hypothetical protein
MEWEQYEAAKKAIEDFDVKYDEIKLNFIHLGDALNAGGWEAVEFTNQQQIDEPNRFIDSGNPTVDRQVIETASIVRIVTDRRVLAQQLRAAFLALPESRRKGLCSARQKAKSRTENRR